MTKIASFILIYVLGITVASAMPPNQAGAPPYWTDGIYTYFAAPDTSTNNLKLKIVRFGPVTLYRRIPKTGVMQVAGAEILLLGLPPAAKREVSAQRGYLQVIDTAANGTTTFSSWDISALTNPYLPPPAKPGEDIS